MLGAHVGSIFVIVPVDEVESDRDCSQRPRCARQWLAVVTPARIVAMSRAVFERFDVEVYVDDHSDPAP